MTSAMREIWICGAARTPIGAFQGALAGVSAPKLGAVAVEAALSRAGLKPEQVDEVILGNVLSAGVGQAPARQAAIQAKIPYSVPALTLNKVCGSGMKAVMLGAQSILTGEAAVVVTGGMENMSRAPYLVTEARGGFKMGHQQMLDSMISDGLWDPYSDQHMGNCGELCAREKGFTREQQDEIAALSFKRAQAAQAAGEFKAEIAPVTIATRKGEVRVESDEGPSRIAPDKVATLRPVFDKNGTITAANASSLNDGAAALVLVAPERARQLGLKPLARIAGWGTFSQDPQWFTVSPAEAMRRALARAGWRLEEVDLFEVNEAFAVVALAAEKELGLSRDRLNVRGGAVSLGHPIGASGARILVTLLQALKDKGLKKGLAGICIGGGEATAMAVELMG